MSGPNTSYAFEFRLGPQLFPMVGMFIRSRNTTRFVSLFGVRHQVDVCSPEVRTKILEEGGLHFDKRKKKSGRILLSDVQSLGLQARDSLQPAFELPDIADFEVIDIPFKCKFWRRHLDEKGRCMDQVSARVPLFADLMVRTFRSSIWIHSILFISVWPVIWFTIY